METYLLSEEEERKVQEGQAAAALLDSPVFLLAIERVRAQCAESILTSPPEHSANRERLYHLSRGLSAVTEELTALAAAAEAIIENAKLSTPTPDTLDELSEDGADY